MPKKQKFEPLPTRLYAKRYPYSMGLDVEENPKELASQDETVELGVYCLVGTVSVASRTEVSAVFMPGGPK